MPRLNLPRLDSEAGQHGCREVGAAQKMPGIWNPIPDAVSYADVLSCSTLSCWAELVRGFGAWVLQRGGKRRWN
jgi:hypothetical protein